MAIFKDINYEHMRALVESNLYYYIIQDLLDDDKVVRDNAKRAWKDSEDIVNIVLYTILNNCSESDDITDTMIVSIEHELY